MKINEKTNMMDALPTAMDTVLGPAWHLATDQKDVWRNVHWP